MERKAAALGKMTPQELMDALRSMKLSASGEKTESWWLSFPPVSTERPEGELDREATNFGLIELSIYLLWLYTGSPGTGNRQLGPRRGRHEWRQQRRLR